MADFAGAVAAMRARFESAWTATPVAFQNEPFDKPNPPSPWVYFEVLGNQSEIRGAGTPGDNIWLDEGHILIHVFVPVNSGDAQARAHAVAAGEIFRAAGFYNDGQGSIVRTAAPRVDGGGTASDDGNWFRMTCVIPFEYYHRG